MKRIGIIIIATNSYFVLGVRLLKRFMHFYKGDSNVTFYFFSDRSPYGYYPDGLNVEYIETQHADWVSATNSKFKNILDIREKLVEEQDYVYYLDADTSADKDFTDDWFIGNLVAGEHFGSREMIRTGQIPYDRNVHSEAYIPYNTELEQIYYYGAFFGGKTGHVLNMCLDLYSWQLIDKEIGYEPAVNDESYINKYFHYNRPTLIVKTEDFKLVVSDKGGLGETRDPYLAVEQHLMMMRKHKDDLIDFQYGVLKVNQ